MKFDHSASWRKFERKYPPSSIFPGLRHGAFDTSPYHPLSAGKKFVLSSHTTAQISRASDSVARIVSNATRPEADRIEALATLVSTMPAEAPEVVVRELERGHLSALWFDHLMAAVEAVHLDEANHRTRAALAIEKRLAERPGEDSPPVWSGLRRLASLSSVGELARMVPWISGSNGDRSRQAALQATAAVLSAPGADRNRIPTALASCIADTLDELTERPPGAQRDAMIFSAIGALAATKDARLPERVARIAAGRDAVFRRQLRSHLRAAGSRFLTSEGAVPKPIADSVESLTG